jgi:hypothetical protein
MAQGVHVAVAMLRQLVDDEGDRMGHDSDGNHGGEHTR